MLEVKGINTFYGKSHVLHDLSLEVKRGELVGLLGRNGMGKSTTLKSIMGLVSPRSGQVLFDNRHVSHLPPHRIPRLGIGYVPQGRHIFPKLTVLENIKIALVDKAMDKGLLDQIFEYFPLLKERLLQPGGTLSGGEQQMLAIARGLITKPKLMLLDEPTEGLMPLLVKLIKETVRLINEKGVSLLLVEQNVKMALNICKRIYIIEKGKIVFEGLAKELTADEPMQQRYLGVHI